MNRCREASIHDDCIVVSTTHLVKISFVNGHSTAGTANASLSLEKIERCFCPRLSSARKEGLSTAESSEQHGTVTSGAMLYLLSSSRCSTATDIGCALRSCTCECGVRSISRLSNSGRL